MSMAICMGLLAVVHGYYAVSDTGGWRLAYALLAALCAAASAVFWQDAMRQPEKERVENE